MVCGACTRGSLRFCDDDDGGGGLFFVSPSTGSKIPVEQVIPVVTIVQVLWRSAAPSQSHWGSLGVCVTGMCKGMQVFDEPCCKQGATTVPLLLLLLLLRRRRRLSGWWWRGSQPPCAAEIRRVCTAPQCADIGHSLRTITSCCCKNDGCVPDGASARVTQQFSPFSAVPSRLQQYVPPAAKLDRNSLGP